MIVNFLGSDKTKVTVVLDSALKQKIIETQSDTTIDNESKQALLDEYNTQLEKLAVDKMVKTVSIYLVCFAIIDIAFIVLIVYRLRKKKKE